LSSIQATQPFVTSRNNGCDAYRDSPHFERTAEFCALYDEISFDPEYVTEPLDVFVPMVRRVLSKQWAPPDPTTS
jgi:hypothetical protein